MRSNRVRIWMLSAAVAVAPAAMFGQTEMAAWQASMPGSMAPGSPANNTNAPVNNSPASSAPGNMAPGTQDSGSMGAEAQVMKDKTFVRKAAEGGFAEVQFGQLALQKSNNDGVKQFAQKMIDDHTALDNQMQPVADNLGVKTPKKLNKMDQAEYEKLSALSGDEFDKEYIAMMVKDHRKDFREFREESQAASDPQLKQAVTQGTQVIGEHLAMVNKLAHANGVEVPRGGGGKPAQ